MNSPEDIWATTAVAKSGVDRGSAAAGAIEHRADIMKMTQTAENAVLNPGDPGIWDRPMRVAFAVRIARLNGADGLAKHYADSTDISKYVSIADPGVGENVAASVKFLDAVATKPRDITAQDIKLLQDADISDADIVRLTELVAFVSYQVRLVAGLSLLSGTPA